VVKGFSSETETGLADVEGKGFVDALEKGLAVVVATGFASAEAGALGLGLGLAVPCRERTNPGRRTRFQ
jgi:hypothetical protein